MPNRLKELRNKAGLSQQQLADRIGTSRQQIVKLESGERRLSIPWMDRIAPVLNCRPGELASELEDPEHGRFIQVKGFVKAGFWAETNELDPEEWTVIPWHQRFDRYQSVMGVEVRGDSMNMRFPEGSIVIVSHILDYGKEPENGDFVIVVRHCTDGLHEWTVKALKIIGEERWLLPESSNPRHVPIRVPNGHGPETTMDDGRNIEEVQIWGVVVGFYDPNQPKAF